MLTLLKKQKAISHYWNLLIAGWKECLAPSLTDDADNSFWQILQKDIQGSLAEAEKENLAAL